MMMGLAVFTLFFSLGSPFNCALPMEDPRGDGGLILGEVSPVPGVSSEAVDLLYVWAEDQWHGPCLLGREAAPGGPAGSAGRWWAMDSPFGKSWVGVGRSRLIRWRVEPLRLSSGALGNQLPGLLRLDFGGKVEWLANQRAVFSLGSPPPLPAPHFASPYLQHWEQPPPLRYLREPPADNPQYALLGVPRPAPEEIRIRLNLTTFAVGIEIGEGILGEFAGRQAGVHPNYELRNAHFGLKGRGVWRTRPRLAANPSGTGGKWVQPDGCIPCWEQPGYAPAGIRLTYHDRYLTGEGSLPATGWRCAADLEIECLHGLEGTRWRLSGLGPEYRLLEFEEVERVERGIRLREPVSLLPGGGWFTTCSGRGSGNFRGNSGAGRSLPPGFLRLGPDLDSFSIGREGRTFLEVNHLFCEDRRMSGWMRVAEETLPIARRFGGGQWDCEVGPFHIRTERKAGAPARIEVADGGGTGRISGRIVDLDHSGHFIERFRVPDGTNRHEKCFWIGRHPVRPGFDPELWVTWTPGK